MDLAFDGGIHVPAAALLWRPPAASTELAANVLHRTAAAARLVVGQPGSATAATLECRPDGAKVRRGRVQIRPLGGWPGCLLMILFSVIASVLLTVLVNLLVN